MLWGAAFHWALNAKAVFHQVNHYKTHECLCKNKINFNKWCSNKHEKETYCLRDVVKMQWCTVVSTKCAIKQQTSSLPKENDVGGSICYLNE